MILELKNIEKSFGEKKVLTGVSFKAEGGKAFGLLGRNGAGKTTSIRILMDVFPANSGEVLIDGQAHRLQQNRNRISPRGERTISKKDYHRPAYIFCGA